ncbi:nucleotidyl transferase AbiEii/AbiGii toxin family protein [Micromonospora inositola]|uniref:Nucleotidyl transferase AbiEii toxin, Type IV TA system n=1 Tax=Micromonospora inositola TaxID=47865 RepID=A0A1C5H1P2_9ACTN|nr:nucleotidyl transferase AbiEii/AbiGii toxin family protein [Micromonospora inositola]SCG39747.1 Nucleotidyl transferase AbiEii toxin, Type IV TA system [Micromonospora inositola]
MTERPTRATVAGRAYLDLQNLARRTGRPTDELHQVYALEGFLARLAQSAYAGKLVLKGGVLLAAYAARRPTRDVDLQGRWISNGTDQVLGIVRGIAAQHLDDGLVFDAASASAEMIRDDDVYSGVRVSLTGSLSAARLTFHVDVNVGDPIWPDPQPIKLPRLLDGEIVVTGYPLPMVYAEKLVTALQRGVANTRWRDFADVYLLSERHDVDGDELAAAVQRVAEYREVALAPLSQALEGYATLAQPRWAAWRRKHRLDDRLPQNFDVVLQRAFALADPAVSGISRSQTWIARASAWTAM